MQEAMPQDLCPFHSVLLEVLMAFRHGDFTVRMPSDRTGLEGKVADTLDEVLDIEESLLEEFRGYFDCMALDLNLPDMTGLERLKALVRDHGRVGLPVIIHTAR
jgi:DNA-binding response OmpR family regulator